MRIFLRKKVVIGSKSSSNKNNDFDDAGKEEDNTNNKVSSFSEAQELQGSLAHSEDLNKLMRSVLDNNKELIDEGQIIAQGVSSGINNFTPDLMFEQLVNNYKNAKKIFGERIIRLTTGFSSEYIEKNIRIPEFKRQLKNNLEQSIKSLRDEGLISESGEITKKGLRIATANLINDEFERMKQKGLIGERVSRTKSPGGLVSEERAFKKGDSYKDINIKSSVKKTLRRGHSRIIVDDLMVNDRESKQRASIMLAIDSSGSMRGVKFSSARRAAIALAYKAINEKDEVGVLLFEKKIIVKEPPSKDFNKIVSKVVKGKAGKETDISIAINESVELLKNTKGKKHIIIITDGLQTIGDDPEKKVLESVSNALKNDVTISIIGLSLNDEGERLSKLIVDEGKGSLYLIKNYDDLDVLVLEDYYKTRNY